MHSFCDSHVEEDLHLFLNCDFSRYNGWACKILFLLLKRIWAQLKTEISFFNGGDYYNVQEHWDSEKRLHLQKRSNFC